MTIKPKLAAILLACLMLGSSMSVGAAKQEQEQELLEEPAVTMPQAPLQHYPSVPLFIHDVKGNPVSCSTLDPVSDIPCSNDDGRITMTFADLSEPFVLGLINPVNGEQMNYKLFFQVEPGKDTQLCKLLWNKELPEDSVKKVKEKVKFRAVDQNGEPLEGVRFVFHDQRFIYPTNADGETWYWQDPVKYNSMSSLKTKRATTRTSASGAPSPSSSWRTPIPPSFLRSTPRRHDAAPNSRTSLLLVEGKRSRAGRLPPATLVCTKLGVAR